MRWLILILTYAVLGTTVYAQEYRHVLVFLNSKPDKPVIPQEKQEELQAAHMKNINRLVAEEKLIVAGPFDGGGGIFIFKSGEVVEVKEWLSTDPAVKANRWNIEMFPVRFLMGGVCLAPEPYEMTAYNFVRVSFINDIANYKMNRGDQDIWQDLQFHEQAMMVGAFPQSDGGVIVYTGKNQDLWFGKNQEDLIELEHRSLWVAKGSFCESW